MLLFWKKYAPLCSFSGKNMLLFYCFKKFLAWDPCDSIRSKLFNYKDFVQTLNVDAFIEDNNTLPCDCHNSPFMDSDHNHILTGDLNINF